MMSYASPLSLYDVTIPVMVSSFGILARILDKGRAFADETGLAPSVLIEARLAADMLPLAGQVQRASDTAKFAAVRLGGAANVAMPDEEKSFADLQARIKATVAVLEAVSPDAVNASIKAEVVLKTGRGEHTFTGRSYALRFALPNFYFHVTTAYDILRHAGVPVGKADYLGL